MATFTTWYNLRKPADSDFVSVGADIGAAMTILDDEMRNRELDIATHALRLAALEFPIRAKMRKTADQSINDSTATLVQWAIDSVSNPAGFANQANNRFVVPVIGDYLLDMIIPWAPDVDGRRDIVINVNGVGRRAFRTLSAGGGGVNTYQNVTCKLTLNPGDLVTVEATHNAGAALNIFGGAANSTTECYATMLLLNQI